MPIQIQCNQCRAVLRIPDHAAGKRVRCPKCAAIVCVPTSDAVADPSAAESLPAQPDSGSLSSASQDSSARKDRAAKPPQPSPSPLRNSSPTSLPELATWGLVLLVIGAVSFWIGRVFPDIGSGVVGSGPSTTESAELSNESIIAGTAAQELEQIADLDPAMAFGDDMEPDSQPDDGRRISMPEFQKEDAGEMGSFNSSGSPASDFTRVLKAQYAVRVEERRKGRYRAAALLASQPEDKSIQALQFRIAGLVPPLNDQNSNAGWVFRHLAFSSSLITDSGTIIRHPDAAEFDSITQAIVSGAAGPAAVLKSLQKMRYPVSRESVFVAVAQKQDLPAGQRAMCLQLLGCPVVLGLFYDMDVGPGGLSGAVEHEHALTALATPGLPPDMSDLVVDAIVTRTKVHPQLFRKLHAQVFGEVDSEQPGTGSRDTLSASDTEALFAVWENASTDALLRLMLAMNGKNRSAQLRRLFRERQLTEAQIESIVTPRSSAEEVDALLGKVPIAKIIDIVFTEGDGFPPIMHAVSLAENLSLTTADANELAKACIRFKDDYEAISVLDKLQDKADQEHYIIALAQCGHARDLEDQLSKIRDPAERMRILHRAANELQHGHPKPETLSCLAPYGQVSNLLAALEKTEPGPGLRDVISKLSSRSDLTENERLTLRKYQNPE